MSYTTFGQLTKQLVRHFQNRQYPEALDLIMAEGDNFPLALEGSIPVRGFVVNGPAVPYLDAPEQLDKLLVSTRERGLRAYFILGEQDDAINTPEAKNLAEKLKASGIPCEVEMVPEATHDYTPAYDAALRRGLAFASSEGPNS